MAVAYDEFWRAEAEPRQHQALLADLLLSLGHGERELLERSVRRRLREQDVTFNTFGSPDGGNQPWSLDWLPAALDRGEYESLASALKQRAQALSLVLDDLYGARRLLRDGIIPPEIVLGNPNYVRPAHGWLPTGGWRLVLYAADVGRGPDGAFSAFSDRTAAPTGSGYALQNRMVVGRVLADAFREFRVSKLDRFFTAVGAALEHLAPNGAASPRIVVLTPGLGDESAFEHAYLARYLGFDLVEGRDLTVRGNQVFSKSLTGLQRVDVMVRRVFDGLCDPLFLRGDSTMGVPGLLEVARRGGVGIANPIGSGLVESPVFKAYLPAMTRALLGAPLALPSVPTRWCGAPEMLEEVMDTADAWIIKPAFSERRRPPTPVHRLPASERDALFVRVRQEPQRWVAERWPELSRTAIATGGRGTAALSLRLFLCRDQNEGFTVLPGGLGRLDASPDGVFIDRGGEGLTKDVWVPSGSTSPPPKLPTMPAVWGTLLRGGVDLPSRLLDDVHWLGRYAERCEAAARLLRLGIERRVHAESEVLTALTLPLRTALIDLEMVPTTVARLDSSLPGSSLPGSSLPGSALPGSSLPEPAPLSEVSTLLEMALLEGRSPNNLPACLQQVHALAGKVRGRLSRDVWGVLQQFRDVLSGLGDLPRNERLDRALENLEQLLLLSASLRGHALDGMVRGYAWRFMDMGRRLERAAAVLSLMRAFLPVGANRDHMEALLESCDSLLTYRARYMTALRVAPTVDLLLADATNPRSVLYQVDQLITHTEHIPRTNEASLSAAERGLIQLRGRLLSSDIVELCGGDGSALQQLLEASRTSLLQVADDIARQYFAHARASATDATPQWVDAEVL